MVTHRFKEEGRYRIAAKVNDICLYEKMINVKKPEPAIRAFREYHGRALSGSTRVVGDNFVFSTPLHANNYEWYIENNNAYPKKNWRQCI